MTQTVHLFQTADAERYFDMLSVTLPANRAFCRRHGVRLEAFIGIRRGRASPGTRATTASASCATGWPRRSAAGSSISTPMPSSPTRLRHP
jgi:hypothetical protein